MNIGISNAADCDEEVDLLPDDEIEVYDQEHGITRELIASHNSQPGRERNHQRGHDLVTI
jgi:hypothetical protein